MAGEDKFKFKLIREAWAVISYEVDQYNHGLEIGERIKHGSYASYEEAYSHLPDFAEPHKYVMGRWIPKDKSHDYWETTVRHVDEVVFEGDRIEVTIQLMRLKS